MASKAKSQGLFDGQIMAAAAIGALRKLDPRALAKNPVIFVTEAVSLMVTVFFVRDLVTGNGSAAFSGQIAAWLWFTVLFANFAEAVAEGRGKAQADALRRTRSDTRAKRYVDPENLSGVVEGVNALDLRLGDIVLVEAGETIPGDGDIVEGVASVDVEHEDKVRFRAIYAAKIQPVLEQPEPNLMGPLRVLVAASLHGVLDDLENICEEERQLNRQVRLYHWLHGWLLIHVPLSIVLLVLGGVHAVMALRY